MAKDEGGSPDNMSRSAREQKTNAQRMDISKYTKTDRGQKKEEGRDKQQPQTRTESKVTKRNSDINRTAKKSIKMDKRNFVDMLAEKAEDAAYQGNMRELFTTIRKLSGNLQNQRDQ